MEFQILSEDYSKAVFLCQDRTVNFHAKFGAYYKTRVVRAGVCNLCVCIAGAAGRQGSGRECRRGGLRGRRTAMVGAG